MPVFEELVRSRAAGKKAALALIVQCVGSSPQKEGAKMLVREDGTIVGTLGGGCLEEDVRQVCLAAIEEGTATTISVGLTENEGGMVCGGQVLVYVEPILPEPRLVILGAGHVGRALARTAAHAGFRVTVVDDRAEHAAPERFPDAERILVGPFGSTLEGAGIDDGQLPARRHAGAPPGLRRGRGRAAHPGPLRRPRRQPAQEEAALRGAGAAGVRRRGPRAGRHARGAAHRLGHARGDRGEHRRTDDRGQEVS